MKRQLIKNRKGLSQATLEKYKKNTEEGKEFLNFTSKQLEIMEINVKLNKIEIQKSNLEFRLKCLEGKLLNF